jgi:serine/threonine protein kinase
MSGPLLKSCINERYEVVAELGRGGMATVFRAYDRQRKAEVALKVLHQEQLVEERKVERFLREFEILSSCTHSNVVAAYDQGLIENSIPFFTLELLQGKNLADFIKERSSQNKIDLGASVGLLLQIAHGLAHLHEKGVAFCDLTPSNIFLSDVAGQAATTVKLMDFGIARYINNQSDQKNESKVGTALYMSPEQSSQQPLDLRTDIYSFGVVAFELLTGKPPYKTEVEYKVEFLHQMANVPSAKELNKEIPSSLDRLIRRCMEKDREHRFSSIREVVTRLESVVTSLSAPSLFQRIFGH